MVGSLACLAEEECVEAEGLAPVAERTYLEVVAGMQTVDCFLLLDLVRALL
jgi:hypothetical protein